MKQRACLLIVLLIAIGLRLYPMMMSGLPFSTDAWPLIGNAELMLEHTPVQLGGNSIFDDYNIYWPVTQAFGIVASEVFAIEPMQAMAFFIPLAGSFSILIFYIIVRRLTEDEWVSLLAALLLATNGTHATLIAGVMKETYANPLYLLAFYLLVIRPRISSLLSFMLVMITLVATHHLTTLAFFVIMVSVVLASSMLPSKEKSAKRMLSAVIIALAITVGYYLGYAAPGMKYDVSSSDWISGLAFQALAFTSMLFAFLLPAPRRLPVIWASPLLFSALLLAINQRTAIVPGAPSLPDQLLIYVYAFLALGFLVMIGLFVLRKKMEHAFPIAFWLSAMLGLMAYAVFAAQPGLSFSLAYRLINFIYPALAALSAIAIVAIYAKIRSRLNVHAALTLILIPIVSLATVSAHQTYAATIQQENYLGYQGFHSNQDYCQALWVKEHTKEGQSIVGDNKVNYLIEGYFGLKVDLEKGYRYLTGDDALPSSAFLVTYPSMRKNGYVIGPYGIELPDGWIARTHSMNKVYSNSGNDLYISP